MAPRTGGVGKIDKIEIIFKKLGLSQWQPYFAYYQLYTKYSIHHNTFHHIVGFNDVNACGVAGNSVVAQNFLNSLVFFNGNWQKNTHAIFFL